MLPSYKTLLPSPMAASCCLKRVRSGRLPSRLPRCLFQGPHHPQHQATYHVHRCWQSSNQRDPSCASANKRIAMFHQLPRIARGLGPSAPAPLAWRLRRQPQHHQSRRETSPTHPFPNHVTF
ncbi:hypothetical protein BU16DRAFT_144339 [Lophium mytilinum]|uniref:Uncharacterized protein n=1 Tax=Lophium mytilinum TaxID=390894 RepID=A0A6A6QGI9_9PEZI|nr:hypothetical protein BU16DRAFT_144339 [Lophium mytilinum]